MPAINWAAFEALPGSNSQNFENLCRGLMRLHFGRFGQFKALSNQPGVEFHLALKKKCALGDVAQWFGWQCKFHKRTASGYLAASSKRDILESLQTTERELPNITDWVLWTPYTLSKNDQTWFYSLNKSMTLHLWTEEDLDTYLCGDGLLLRSSYFAELVLTPEELALRHNEAIQPISKRWFPAHQTVDAERTIRRMIGEPSSWQQIIAVGERLKKTVEVLTASRYVSVEIEKSLKVFVDACCAFADTLLHLHEILANGDLDIIQQKLAERNTIIDSQVRTTPRLLRTLNLSISLETTNALDDMRIAQELLDEVEEFLGVGLVAVMADAGGGKTQLAAELTSPREDSPAGVLLHGRYLHKGQTLDDLAHYFSINGQPLTSMEKLLAALDAAAKRSKCRLPIVIDGLNESENPKDWKAPLAVLGETVKRYPNVLVVCTLRTGEHRREDQGYGALSQTNARESFAVMALPDGVRKIEIEGFGGDTRDAIEKYFRYFKINPGDAEIPLEFLQHPLTLRIFCEVTNPDRKHEVNVDYFPATLTPLLEKYVVNVCERISQLPNLTYSYNAPDVEAAIYHLGLELWNVKKREVDEASYRATVSDTNRAWDSSVVNLLAQEGIIFRNPGAEPGNYVITPVYDALGGYIVANSLLVKHASDRTFEWFKKPAVISSFGGNDSHELAADIFRALVALAPRRMHGTQIWKEVPEPFRIAALRFATVLEAEYLDIDTVAALLELIKDNPKERPRLFSRLQGIRSATTHPLNSEFLDQALRAMSVSDRDLTWTEWIRATRSEKFNDLLAIELRWKKDTTTRTPSDRLRAKWVMWLLTSTDHELRDVATRTLYWFGRGEPAALFDETLRSLEINDPYVPERMLAASYGVSMARHVDLKDDSFVKKILPQYARRIYEKMFAEGALFGTTHLLMREYAHRTIELATLHDSSLFSYEEIERCRPPFTNGGLRAWSESETSKEELHGLDSPFRMDFENYTIGGLVPDRGNYDFKHAGYRKVRSQLLWRVEQLGWLSELFKTVDNAIANERHWPRIGSDAKKTDRYGKKYSWIAYFEMSGHLYDQRVLVNWRERTSDVDIDPSFPERVTKGQLIKDDFLGDPVMELKEWIAHGPFPDVCPYLRLEEVQNEAGPWLALDGVISQQDETRGRKLYCFMRSFLVSSEDADAFLGHLTNQDCGRSVLPEKPSVIYTFAGEIPWSDTFLKSEQSEFSFVIKEETVKVRRTEKEVYLDGKKMECSPLDLFLRRFGNVAGDAERISDEDLKRIEVRNVPVMIEEVKREYAKIIALIPVCDFRWEGYQTAASDTGRATVLAKEIALDLELIGQPQSFDMYTKGGIRATYNISDQGNVFNNHQSMFFIKENLLQKYIEKNNLVLIWVMWGKREYSSELYYKLSNSADHFEQSHSPFNFVKRY